MRQRTIGNEGSRNALEPPAIGSHTPKPIHNRSQSEGGCNGETNEGHEDSNEDNFNQEESEEDDDDLIIGTPFGTYVLRTKGSKENISTHTLVRVTQDKGKTHQEDTLNMKPLIKEEWENLKRNFEETFKHKGPGIVKVAT